MKLITTFSVRWTVRRPPRASLIPRPWPTLTCSHRWPTPTCSSQCPILTCNHRPWPIPTCNSLQWPTPTCNNPWPTLICNSPCRTLTCRIPTCNNPCPILTCRTLICKTPTRSNVSPFMLLFDVVSFLWTKQRNIVTFDLDHPFGRLNDLSTTSLLSLTFLDFTRDQSASQQKRAYRMAASLAVLRIVSL